MEQIIVDYADYVCSKCGAVTSGRLHKPGSTLISIILWCGGIVPGIMYSNWRSKETRRLCENPECNSQLLVPIDSPKAAKILSDFNIEVRPKPKPELPDYVVEE